MVYSGFADRILKVDLSKSFHEIESPGENFFRTYFGGRALIAHELLTRTESDVDPLGPGNVLVFACGVITGAPIGGTGRNSVGAVSPLTGCYGDAEAGGYWGAELKKAGYDAIVITGRSEEPVYIYIHDNMVEIRRASGFSGLTTAEAEEVIRKETGERQVRVSQCGPAGENLVRFACVVNDLRHFAGRCGMGAVMGSKNLRAIAVKGSGKVIPSDPELFSHVVGWLRKNHKKLAGGFHDLGTIATVESLNISGGLPTRNFREGSFEGAGAIGGYSLKDSYLVARGGCFACPVRCKREVEVGKPWNVDRIYGGPEYETAAAFGSNCGVADLAAVCKANELCNAYGLDSISTGSVISFAMECYEEGIISAGDTDGLELRFGGAREMVELVGKIGRREGIGDILAEGVRRAAKEFGKDAEALAIEVKGQEVPMHEPRFKHGLGLGYAVSPTGADHCHNIHDNLYTKVTRHLREMFPLGILEPLEASDLGEEKVRLFRYETAYRHFLNCALMCYFLPFERSHMVDIVKSVTGWNTSLWEMMKVGERALNLTRVFNIRSGFGGRDDYLPERFFEPFDSGPLKGKSVDRTKLDHARVTYYQMMGWTPQEGIPSRAVLAELGIGWSHRFLPEENRAKRRYS